jgi:hypothetical protein
MKKYIKHSNKFLKLVALRKQLPQKIKLSANLKQVALEKCTSQTSNIMKFQ